MTAQVAVLTPSGAAMASDGAATVGASRAYAGAEKLAILSERARVAAMTYGEASFLGIPWSTYFANFRNEDVPLSDVHHCATRFFALVRSKITPEEQRAWISRHLIGRVYRYQHDRVVTCLHERSWRQGRVVKRVLAESLEEWSARNFCVWFDEDSVARVRAEHHQELVDCARRVFTDVSIDDSSTFSLLVEIGAQSLVREGPQASGVVFVGFGSDRDLPSALDVAVKGVALDTPLIWVKSDQEVQDGWPRVCAYAQDSGAQAFLLGADPAYREFVFELVDRLLAGIADSLLRELGGRARARERLASLLDSLRDDLPSELHQGLQHYEHNNFWLPMHSALAGMSPVALAEVAYSLVSLTWLRQRVGLESPTVGGRIDSLSLSKSMGVRWHGPPGADSERL